MTLNIVVGIPSIGRAAILRETLLELSRQTRPANGIVVCGTNTADVAGIQDVGPRVLTLITEPGLPRQRNAIIDAAQDADVVVFFDDDFLPDPGYLAAIERAMASQPDIVVATGAVLADGIKGPGLSPQEGRTILSDAVHSAHYPRQAALTPTFSGYGCNMVVRLAPMRAHGLRFDERLPLYGWQEDVDLSRRLAPFGAVVRVGAARGVHLGAKSGRGSGVRLGYSQVANPIYLAGKHLGYPRHRAVTHIARNLVSNVVRAPWPESYVDRRGRLRGNLLAIRDALAGRMLPERVLEL